MSGNPVLHGYQFIIRRDQLKTETAKRIWSISDKNVKVANHLLIGGIFNNNCFIYNLAYLNGQKFLIATCTTLSLFLTCTTRGCQSLVSVWCNTHLIQKKSNMISEIDSSNMYYLLYKSYSWVYTCTIGLTLITTTFAFRNFIYVSCINMQKLHSNLGYISDPNIKSKYEILVISQNLECMHQVKYQISRNSLVFKVNLNIDKILHLSMSFFNW